MPKLSPLDIAKPLHDDRQFVAERLALFPYRWQFGFARKYRQLFKKEGRQAANLYLIDQQESIKQHPIGLGSSDEEIQAAAKSKARRYFERIAGRDDYEVLYKEISAEIVPLGVTPPPLKKGATFESLCKRFADPIWWRRALRVAVNRHVEHEAIKANMVGFRAKYVSQETLQRVQQQNKRNTQLLNFIQAENDAGYTSTLADIAAAGVSNPLNRRHELMTRIRGIEEECTRKGFVCDFITITAPSKYHATRYLPGKDKRIPNPNYQGYSPREAQQYLVQVWARVRAEFQRHNIQPVGFRVAEPHADGCPHWHMLLFIERKKAGHMWRIIRKHATKEDSFELKTKNAFEARFDRKVIDPNQGSAAGYIAKYIAKNVSMEGVQDFDNDQGGGIVEALERAVSWSRVWGIRQFQQQGGERITVWRELRKIRDQQDIPELFKPLWRAADAGEYGQFLRQAIQHKIDFIKATEKTRPLYKDVYVPDEKGRFEKRAFKEVGELVDGIYNRYGEPAAGAIKGLIIDGCEIVTRFFKWTFSYKRMPLPKTFSNHKPQKHIETGAKVSAPPDRAKAFNAWLWELAAPLRKGLAGYPRPSKVVLMRVQPASLGLV